MGGVFGMDAGEQRVACRLEGRFARGRRLSGRVAAEAFQVLADNSLQV